MGLGGGGKEEETHPTTLFQRVQTPLVRGGWKEEGKEGHTHTQTGWGVGGGERVVVARCDIIAHA